ncbi:CLIP-associating protein 1-like [Hyalella azteca]|uniref:CLIP-associating protein 1-like n=1 Tax=Hyalella azteca TaxID=294128 RepID=A0A8B7PH12_HYAAZ|nr:CLIP-associating protein 1-like [Hyalella azteca]
MEEFIPLMLTTDTRKKITIGCDLLKYISDPANSIECDDIGRVIDGIVPWMQNSNFKVSTQGLEVMCALVERMKEDFRPYLSGVLPPTIDRLGV